MIFYMIEKINENTGNEEVGIHLDHNVSRLASSKCSVAESDFSHL